MKVKFLTLFFALLCSLACATEVSLKEQLAEASTGSYLVLEQNKIYTFLHVYEKKEKMIVLEEVVVPATHFQRERKSWRDWFQSGGAGHTAWTLTKINLQSGKIEEIYSYPHNGWIDISQADGFMTTLLNLKFKKVEERDRRRIGLPPGYGKPDFRPLWNPRLIVEGKVLTNTPFTVWHARWPSDGSELSRKNIEIYLPEKGETANYPTYFPYWLEVEGKIGSAKIRVIDSGLEVISPKPRIPYRAPKIIGNGSLEEKGLAIEILCPSYYEDFVLIAEEADCCLGKTFMLPFELTRNDNGATLFVSRDQLSLFMSPGEKYRFSISPKENLSICAETPLPLQFR